MPMPSPVVFLRQRGLVTSALTCRRVATEGDRCDGGEPELNLGISSLARVQAHVGLLR